jgi:hypothetical protein
MDDDMKSVTSSRSKKTGISAMMRTTTILRNKNLS